MRFKDWISEVSTYLLALLFFYTALSKIIDFQRFVWEIGNQRFEHWLGQVLIYGLPAVELLATFLLLNLKIRQWGFYLSALLMTVFTLYVALITFHYYHRVPCSCAGVFHAMSWPQHLVFNILFLFITLTGSFLNSTRPHDTKDGKRKGAI